jgi:hypothetical protein
MSCRQAFDEWLLLKERLSRLPCSVWTMDELNFLLGAMDNKATAAFWFSDSEDNMVRLRELIAKGERKYRTIDD